jgi:hypothetical protein
MPQPIDRILPEPHVYLRPDVLDDKPDVALIVCKIFAIYARIEQRLSTLMVRVLGAESAPALAIYGTLTAQHLQLGALDAAAKAKLEANDYQIFKAALSVTESAQAPRHQLAHWSWGGCRQRADLLCLADPKMLSARDFRLAESAQAPKTLAELDPAHILNLIQFEKSQILAYSKADLERAARDLEAARVIVEALLDYIDPSVSGALKRSFTDLDHPGHDQIRVEALGKLNDQPLFRAALARLQSAQKNTPQSVRGSRSPEPGSS